MKTTNCIERQKNYLTGDIVNRVMADESLHGGDKILRMAIISLYGADAPEKIRERAMVIGGVIAATTQKLKGSSGNFLALDFTRTQLTCPLQRY
jgi:hypothetical protein